MENQSVEQRSKSLMNKTKKQLVDIILRKDDVHRKQNETIENMQNHFKVLCNDRDELQKKFDTLTKDANELVDCNKLLDEQISDLNTVLEDKTKENTVCHKEIEELRETIDEQTSKLVEKSIIIDRCSKIVVVSTVIAFVAGILIGIVF